MTQYRLRGLQFALCGAWDFVLVCPTRVHHEVTRSCRQDSAVQCIYWVCWDRTTCLLDTGLHISPLVNNATLHSMAFIGSHRYHYINCRRFLYSQCLLECGGSKWIGAMLVIKHGKPLHLKAYHCQVITCSHLPTPHFESGLIAA